MRPLLCAALLALAAACGDPFGLPRPVIDNVVDTLSLYALHGTPVTYPSALALDQAQPLVRSDLSSSFDFAFDIDTAGRAVLLSTGALRLGRGSGAQRSAAPFDSVVIAPAGGYDADSAVVVTEGTVVIVHSRPSTCGIQLAATYAYYAKLQVLTIDTTSGDNGRRIDFQIIINRNCGYRGLEPGLPSR